MTTTSASVIYPALPDPLTTGDLQELFNPSFDERKWARGVARTPETQVALLVHLKIFQTIGRFMSVGDVPLAGVEYVARKMAIDSDATLTCPIRTHFRHRQAILSRLKVTAWGAAGRALAQATMSKTARARTDPADIMNSAIDALIRHDFELPPLTILRRLAGTWHSKTNTAQWAEVCGRLSSTQHGMLETLLVVDPKTQKSPFANLCATPGRRHHARISTR